MPHLIMSRRAAIPVLPDATARLFDANGVTFVTGCSVPCVSKTHRMGMGRALRRTSLSIDRAQLNVHPQNPRLLPRAGMPQFGVTLAFMPRNRLLCHSSENQE
jgi:hypothetical protein